MTTIDPYWLDTNLELRLRQVSGDAFQRFFADMMRIKYGEDFSGTAVGGVGDKGCDGFLHSTHTVFQCYGAVNETQKKIEKREKDASPRDKIISDFATAMARFGQDVTIREWCFVHNLIDGLPVTAVEAIEQLKKQQDVKITIFSMPRFREVICSLPESDQVSLLGPIPTNEHSLNVQVEELKLLVDRIMVAVDDNVQHQLPIRPVPLEKLVYNELPQHWHHLIAGGWKHTPIIESYFDKSHDPSLGPNVAKIFAVRYRELKSNDLSPGSIMSELYTFIVGKGQAAMARQVAAQVLLSYLFETCEIFESTEEVT